MFRLTQQQCILTKLLNCGSCDLEMLEDIQYDLDDLLDDLEENNNLSLNSLFDAVFYKGQFDLREAYDNLLADLNAEIENDEDVQRQIEELEELDVNKDMSWFTNCQDTHVYLENYNTYMKYLEDEIRKIEDNMGFEFSEGQGVIFKWTVKN